MTYEDPRWDDVQKHIRQNMPIIQRAWDSYHHPPALCGARGCMRACMIHLEESGRIQNTFHNPFRKRKPWRLQGL